MKNIVIMVLCLFAAIACNSCAPQPSPAPPPDPVFDAGPSPTPAPTVTVDAGPPAPQPDVDPGVRDACAALSKIGCVEGGPSCPVVMQKALVDRLTIVPLDCLVGAHTKSDVHNCGKFVACP